MRPGGQEETGPEEHSYVWKGHEFFIARFSMIIEQYHAWVEVMVKALEEQNRQLMEREGLEEYSANPVKKRALRRGKA